MIHFQFHLFQAKKEQLCIRKSSTIRMKTANYSGTEIDRIKILHRKA